jgi:hypothetical protein
MQVAGLPHPISRSFQEPGAGKRKNHRLLIMGNCNERGEGTAYLRNVIT